MAPAEFEVVVAGALWREERLTDRLARLERAILAPWTSEPLAMRDLLGGRLLGESRVPGYRPEDG